MSFVLKGRDFGKIFNAVGARGFFGEGYPFHKISKKFGLTWEGTRFTAKTMTLEPREGNTPLKDNGCTPQELMPKSIWVEPSIGGHMLNCVGLSNFGLEFYLGTGNFQSRLDNYMISIMAMEEDDADKVDEISQMGAIIFRYLGYQKNLAVQINLGCPNTDHGPAKGVESITAQVKALRAVLKHIPIVVNFNALIDVEILKAIEPLVDGYWIGNTVPFNADKRIEWDKITQKVNAQGEPMSPLTLAGMPAEGGLSGPSCLPLTLDKVYLMRQKGIIKPICAGNGIRSSLDVHRLKKVGADACFIGSVAVTQPWAMNDIVLASHELF